LAGSETQSVSGIHNSHSVYPLQAIKVKFVVDGKSNPQASNKIWHLIL